MASILRSENYQTMPLGCYSQSDFLVTLLVGVTMWYTPVKGISIQSGSGFGNVEMFDGVWKNLVTPSLDIPSAKVLCRTLGYPADDVTREDNKAQPTTRATVSLNITCIGNETDINQCQTEVNQSPDVHDELVTLTCKGLTFSLRGGHQKDGIVMVEKGKKLHHVCVDLGSNVPMASTVCQMLGFNSSNALLVNPYRYVDKLSLANSLRVELVCSGNNSDCELHTTNTDEFCQGVANYGIMIFKVLAVFCNDEALEYRLTKPQNKSIGRLDVMINNTWAPVCYSAAGQHFAEEVCTALGLPSTDVRVYKGLFREGDFPPEALPLYYCTSDTEDPTSCSQFSLVGRPCGFDGYLGMSCANASEGQIRLYPDGHGFQSGTVQVYHLKRWFGLAVNPSKHSAIQEATVICRTLNFSTNGVEVAKSWYKSTLWLNSIDCQGDEATLDDCKGTSVETVINRTRGLKLKITCGSDDDAIRLHDDGLLMMRRGGLWGTVCSYMFHNLDAAVICKALNQSSSLARVTRGVNEPKQTGMIWPYAFQCRSIQDDWRSCLRHDSSTCSHESDVHIVCGTLDKSTVEYRLSNEPVAGSGVVEIGINNTWRTVCSRGFAEVEATVVCRNLGLSTRNIRVISSLFTREANMWLSGVNCSGTEASILDCQHEYIGSPNCYSPTPPAAIFCGEKKQIEEFTVRLVGESNTKPSRVEIMLFGEWGTICDKKFDIFSAEAVCRQLGLPSLFASVAEKGTYEEGTGRIWLTNTTCYGANVNGIKDCNYALAGSSCNHSHDVGVVCKGSYSDSTGLIVGCTLGSLAFVVFMVFIFIFIKSRLLKSATSSSVPNTVQYVVPTNASAAPPPYLGNQYKEESPVK